MGGEPARSDRSRFRSRSTFSGGKNPNCRSAGVVAQRAAGERPRFAARQAVRLLQDGVALGHVLPQPPRDLEVVLRLAPRALHLVGVGAGGLLDDDRCRAGSSSSSVVAARRGRPTPSPSSRTRAVLTGRTVTSLQLLERALGGEVEPADGGDVVAPPLEPRRRRHPEAVDVEDAAAHAELRDLGHRAAPGDIPSPRAPRPRSVGACRSPGPRRSRSRSSAAGTSVRSAVARAVVTSDPQPPLEQRLERLGALAGDLVVRLLLAQRLALRVQGDGTVGQQREVGQPALGLARRGGDHDHLSDAAG